MPAPATRYKLLPARGAYAALAAALSDIAEGEIVYAADQDLYYQKEGGVLTPVGVPEAPNDGTQYVRQNQSWAAVDVPPGTIVGTSEDLPGTIETGQLWYDTDTSRLFVYTGTEWVLTSPVASTVTADTPPSNPQDGDLWFDTSDGSGRLYVYYVDADSNQWVDASPDSTGEWLRDDLTSTISTAIAGDSVDIGSSNILLNADGSANFAGNVGIGLTSPAQNLDVASTNNIAYALDGWALAGKGDSSDILFGGILGSQFDTLKLHTSGSERMRIDSSGNVGIGLDTSLAGLCVNNTIRSQNASSNISYIGFTGYTGSTTVGTMYSYIGGDGRNTGYLNFSTNDTERMRIDNSGRLLVGTSTARTNVHSGSLATTQPVQFETATNSRNSGLSIINNSNAGWEANLLIGASGGTTVGSNTAVSNTAGLGAIQFVGGTGTNLRPVAGISAAVDGGTVSDSSMPGRLVFSTTADGASSPTERFRINSTGDCFFPSIGTTAAAANAFLNSGSTPTNVIARSTSSIRYKTGVESVEPEYADKVLQLRPVWYRSKAKMDRQDWSWYGLIAEEVAEVEPRLVHYGYADDAFETAEDGTKQLNPDAEKVPDGVQYERLAVLLLDVVKRQNERIETLEQRLSDAGIA